MTRLVTALCSTVGISTDSAKRLIWWRNLAFCLYGYIHVLIHVKMRSPNQGLGSIPASKKWGSGSDIRVQKIMLWELSLRLLLLWSQNSIFLVVGLNPWIRNCYLWDQMLSSNPISSPCGELMGLWPMLLPNLTQNKEVFLPSNPRGKNLRFWD